MSKFFNRSIKASSFKKSKLFVEKMQERINPVISGDYQFLGFGAGFYFEVRLDDDGDKSTNPNSKVVITSENTPNPQGIRIVATDDQAVPLNGNLDILLQDSDIAVLQSNPLVGPFRGVHVVGNGTGADLIDASGYGGSTTMTYHRVWVEAGAGNDTIIGGGRNDKLEGEDGDDSIVGGLGIDAMHGGNGKDSIIADYADFVSPGPNISGGPDADWLWMDGKPPAAVPTSPGKATYTNTDFETIVGGNGADTVDSKGGPAVNFSGNDGNDSFLGGSGNDALSGGNDNDTLVGGNGRDTISGDNGNDSLVGGNQNDTLNGGNGNDSVQGGNDADSMVGGNGADFLDYQDDSLGVFVALGQSPSFTTITSGPAGGSAIGDIVDFTFENVSGGSGNDFLLGNNLIDTDDSTGGPQGQPGQGNILVGNGGTDQIYGQDGDDSVFGNAGNDTLYGNSGHDSMLGGDNNDLMYGGDGSDSMIGGDGNDDMQGDNHSDYMYGDQLTQSRKTGILRNKDAGGTPNPFPTPIPNQPNYGLDGVTLNGDDVMQGGNGGDTMDGNGGRNILDGGLGEDTFILYGTPGGLATGSPADVDYGNLLNGAVTNGLNQYWGGAEADTFKVIHVWDIYQLTNGVGGVKVQVNNSARVQLIQNYLNDMQNASPIQTDFDAPKDHLIFDQLMT